MRNKYIYILIIISFASFSRAQQVQRALLIGINTYQPDTPSTNLGRSYFPNLEGCRNDMQAIYSVIKSRFQFKSDNIDTLVDHKATRAGIFNKMYMLLNRSMPGDIAFIYYAGHGSQVLNSKSSTKRDQLDETIVPSDISHPGIFDIRDKELAKIFNAFIDKKVKLTVIFDCCHSGSISRGPNLVPGNMRFLPAGDYDFKDDYKPEIPELREGNNFLIFSAAQSDQLAAEHRELVDSGNYISHGAFTYAFIAALQELPNDASAEAIFIAARAILKSNGSAQEPVIGGQPQRRAETLFGLNKGKMLDYSTIAISKIDKDKVILDGGWSLGLNRENELIQLDENNIKDTLCKLKIENVIGVNKSIATILKGKIENLKSGNLFKVSNWASPDIPLLNIYIYPSSFSNSEVSKIIEIARKVKESSQVVWLENLKQGSPYLTIFFDKNKCLYKVDTCQPKELKNMDDQFIINLCKRGGDKSIYFEIPVSEDSANLFISKLNSSRNIHIVSNMESAQYCLFGKLGKHYLPAYGFRKVQVNSKDSLESMPLFTDCFEFQYKTFRSVGDSLATLAGKLSKIRGWLTVIKTPDVNKKDFPFHLEIINEDKKTIVTNQYAINDSISFNIVIDKDFYSRQASIKSKKYVYVFGLDQSGNMLLYFPDSASGNALNKFPKYKANDEPVDTFPIDISYRVGLPTGTDNFFMLATDDPIPNAYNVFNQLGVNTDAISRGITKDSYRENPLTALFDLGNEPVEDAKSPTARGGIDNKGRPPVKLQASWNLLKYAFKCTYPDK